jgi:anaerobic magnesium-protoporphyrin IX monomethyl ester cyclase
MASMPSIALVGPEIEENLSLRYIASSLERAGMSAEIVPFNRDVDFGPALEAILAMQPPAVGISLAFQWRARDFLALAIGLRERGYRGHITCGGHFATFACRELLRDFPEVDSIVRQEAEDTMVALLRALPEGGLDAIPGLALRDEGGAVFVTPDAALPDVHTLPWPDRRGEPARCFDHGIAPLVSSRGCYANCSFCCIAAWHEQSLPGKRYRLRDVEVVADEMVALWRERGVDIFVFHDDNFFVPGHHRNKERLSALADALEARGIGRFATVVKARPTDVDPEVFGILRHRLHCIRAYVGIETDADQGLETLRRWSPAKLNRRAVEVVRSLDLYTCFNMLLFDPDTDVESLRVNLEFMRFAAELPSNFGRVELYAGTPLLGRMLAEGRATGDYLQHDYALASPAVERIFELSMRCFHERNFGEGALNNRIMATRFDLEVFRHFHPDLFDAAWLEEGQALTRELTLDSVRALGSILSHVDGGAPHAEDDALQLELTQGLRRAEARIGRAARDLARRLMTAVGRGLPLTQLGVDAATPLQTSRDASAALGAHP